MARAPRAGDRVGAEATRAEDLDADLARHAPALLNEDGTPALGLVCGADAHYYLIKYMAKPLDVLHMRRTDVAQPVDRAFLESLDAVSEDDDECWRFAPVGVPAHYERDILNLVQMRAFAKVCDSVHRRVVTTP